MLVVGSKKIQQVKRPTDPKQHGYKEGTLLPRKDERRRTRRKRKLRQATGEIVSRDRVSLYTRRREGQGFLEDNSERT